MRDLSPEMLTYIQNNATSLQLCWEIRRLDGVSFYYTEYDENLIINGNEYKKRNSGVGKSLRFSDLLKGNNSNIDMLLTESDGITLPDLYNFKYDGAEIFISIVNPEDPDDQIKLVHGILGQTENNDGKATINYKSVIDLLNKPIGRVFAPECDAELFDSYCIADSTGHQFFNRTPTGIDPIKPFTVFTDTTLAQADFWFNDAYFKWTSGSNEGVSTKVKSYINDVIILSMGMPNAIESGDEYTIYTGCDKSSETCKNKFNNILNFKGFPTIPNADKISTYA